MKPIFLALVLAPFAAACADDNSFTGSYTGSVTISATGGQTVATATTNLLPEQDSAQLFGSSGSTSIDCNINGLGHRGDTATFRCGELGCSCSVGATPYDVTTAGGTLVGDHLTLDFSGMFDLGEAFSATFEGDLEPGTR